MPFLQVQLPHEHVRPSGTLSATPVYPKMVATKIYFKPPQTEMQVFTFKPSLNFLVPKALHDIFCKTANFQTTAKLSANKLPTLHGPLVSLATLCMVEKKFAKADTEAYTGLHLLWEKKLAKADTGACIS